METSSIAGNRGEIHHVTMDDSRKPEPTAPEMVTPRLIALRNALGLSKADFADIVGIDRSSYSKIEKANKPLLPKDAYRIWELYAVDMNYIYLGRIDNLPSTLSAKIISHLNGVKQ